MLLAGTFRLDPRNDSAASKDVQIGGSRANEAPPGLGKRKKEDRDTDLKQDDEDAYEANPH